MIERRVAAALRKIGDLPKGVMAQWRRWCLHRDYIGHFGFFRPAFEATLWQRYLLPELA